MLQSLKIAILALAMLSLVGCGYTIRESGFLYTDFVKGSSYPPGAINIWDTPRISLESSCDGTNYTGTFGPYFVLPLFIIPNPFLPATYPYHTFRNATISLTVYATPNDRTWDAVLPRMQLNGVPLKIDQISLDGFRRYVYRPNISCGKLDDSELTIEIDIPQQPLLTRTLFYRHRWRVVFEGI